MSRTSSKLKTCSGLSMYPTIRNGDGLIIEEYKESCQIKKGDVIIFYSIKKNKDIVHRIVSIEKDGVITRGDNNLSNDSPVPFSAIKAIVREANRTNKTFPVYGGNTGFARHKLLQARKYVFPKLIPIPKLILDSTEKSGIFKFIHDFLKVKVVCLAAENRQTRKLLLLGRKIIGSFSFESNQWHIKYPYRPFINKKKL